ncbi:MAG: leucine-rich repeat domain-containing protein [Caldilineaceae bacterium]
MQPKNHTAWLNKTFSPLLSWAMFSCIILLGLCLASPKSFKALRGFNAVDTFSCTLVNEIPQTECQALVDLYTNTNGDHWTNQTNWLATFTPCSWYGISCSGGHVIDINLPRNGLQGSLPVSVGNLSNLHWFILPFNRLNGPLPTGLGNSPQLESIDLFQNQLTGELPVQLGSLTNLLALNLEENKLSGPLPLALGNLGKLEYLYLGHNQLTGSIPSQFGQLSNVRVITLHDNYLTGSLPPELGNLTHLTGLILWINQLQGAIPASFGNLALLQQLALSDNQLSGAIPPELGKLSALQELNLSNNQLTGAIPAELSGLVNLQYLYLSHNRLTGPIPPALGNLVNLRHFTLYENLLSGGIPSELGNLVALEELDFGNAGLQGVIPASLTSLSQLRKLQLWSNRLQGEIPAGISNLPHLQILGLSNNQLTGAIPSNIGNLTGLTELYLDNNHFSGVLPTTLGSLTNVITMTLDNNELNGALPAQLGQLSSLRILDLGKNKLSGTIPAELGNLSQLRRLYLWLNQLQGTLPPSLGNLTKLQILGLSDNQLSGAIPPELGKLSALQEVNFSNNQLTGPVPIELGGLANLQYLYFSHNQLNGAIPAQLGNLSQLRVLHLGENKFTGALPTDLGRLSSLESLFLWNNNLSGTIPDSLTKLTNLKGLWLNDNALQGAIPVDIGNLTKLEELNLSKNQLSGPVPTSLGNLAALRKLYLNHNQLSGTLPSELGNLTQLEHVILWVNQVTGPIPPSLGKLTNLTILGLSENAFTGSIPATLGNLNHLIELHLHTNHLSGTLPGELGNLTTLQALYLANNTFTRDIPTTWSNLTNLTTLSLRYNRLTAADPATLSFVNSKDAGWSGTQTVTPLNLQVKALNSQIIQLSWTPSPYQQDGGGYQVSYGTDRGGPYPFQTLISNKATDRFHIGGLTAGKTYFFVLRTHTPAHGQQANELWSGDSTEVSIKMPEPPPPGANDESDACVNATPISMDGVAYTYAFQTPNDQDWVQFEAQKDVAYRIEAQAPVGSPADVVLDVYENCVSAPTLSWDKDYTLGGRLIVTAHQSGPLYIRSRNHDGSIAGDQVKYMISVQQVSTNAQHGALIIVEGRGRFNDPVQPNIYATTNRIYQLFQENGYTNDDVEYLGVEAANRPGFDTNSTVENLHYAITTWAKTRVGVSRPLTLYLIDHGDSNRLYLDEPQQQWLTPEALDSWLTELQAGSPELKINLIIESCHAGSFIRGTHSLSKAGRVIITSTSPDALAWVSEQGIHFSDQLLTSLSQGMNLALSFQTAREAVQQAHIYQEPWLDANANGVPNESEDVVIAAQRSFSAVGTLEGSPNSAAERWSPYIAQVQPPQLNQNLEEFRINVRDDLKVANVWAIVYPPSYRPPGESNVLVQEEPLQTVKLLEQGNGWYGANYPAFTEPGNYRVVFYAEDEQKLQARPFAIEIAVGQRVFLPFIRR